MPEAVIVDAIRTPIGRAFKGSLAQQRPDEMGAHIVDRLLERNPQVKADSVEDVKVQTTMFDAAYGHNGGAVNNTGPTTASAIQLRR